jgi:hypothetical protein
MLLIDTEDSPVNRVRRSDGQQAGEFSEAGATNLILVKQSSGLLLKTQATEVEESSGGP